MVVLHGQKALGKIYSSGFQRLVKEEEEGRSAWFNEEKKNEKTNNQNRRYNQPSIQVKCCIEGNSCEHATKDFSNGQSEQTQFRYGSDKTDPVSVWTD